MNIVSMIMQYLGPMIIGKFASSLGLNQGIAGKLIAAALPTILAGIMGRVSQPGGAQALADAIGKQDTGLLGNLGNLLGSPQQAKVAESGLGTLGSLLGNSGLGALTSALGKFGSVDDKASKGVLGMLAPVALGALGQQQKSAGLDAAGLAKMLLGQKDNIQAAMPADFSKMLSGTGLLDSLGATAARAAAPAQPSVVEMPRSAPVSSGRPMWQWLATAVAALLLGWYFFGGSSAPKRVALPATPSVMAGNVNIGNQLGTTVGDLQNVLLGIRDKASAETALPKLRTAQGDIDRIAGQFGSLPAEGKKSLASYLAAALPILRPLIGSALDNSAVAPILKPLLDGMLDKLVTMSKG